MFFHILKKDLKRKKTMNVILLLFVILSAMFASSSVNNIITVTGGIDYFFDKAGISDIDYFMLTMSKGQEDGLTAKLESEPAITEINREIALYNTAENFTVNGKRVLEYDNASMVQSVASSYINFFDADDNVIESVPKGSFYMTNRFAENYGAKPGDKFEISVGDFTKVLEYKGRAKDAVLGSNFMNNPRIIISDEDFEEYLADESTKNYQGTVFYIKGDVKLIEQAIANDNTILFDGSASIIRTTYVMEVLVAAMLLVVSVILILIAFVVLRFTIGFTLTEEFREIGVMKAIGIKNRHIRLLYITKYFGISVVGAVIGYFLAIPFGKMMLGSATDSMVLGNDSEVLVGALSAVGVVAVIVLFCYGCTRRIKKLSPIDAVRSGQTGERFRKKSIMSLSKSRLGAGSFLPMNDVVSAPKQYGIMTLIFTVCLLLITILANTANTLRSDKLMFLFGTTTSDLYWANSSKSMDFMAVQGAYEDTVAQMEQDLADLGIPGKVHQETWYKIPAEYNGFKQNITMLWCRETDASDYVYERGTAPQNAHEFATTPQICEKFGFDIGDKVMLTVSGKTEEYLLTAVFQSMDQLGMVGRLHQDAPIVYTDMTSAFSFQIDFDDDPDADTIEERKQILMDYWNTDRIENASEFVNSITGVSDMIASVRDLVLVLTLIIIVLITVMMERSFISKETSEIALMKALGFRDLAIAGQHTARFAIVAVLAGIIASALCLPLTNLIIDPIFGIMGATAGVDYLIKPAEIFLIYPLAVLAAVVLGAFFTALYTKSVKASDVSNIE